MTGSSDMDLLARFRAFIDREKLPLPKNQLLIAVSGGVDSVVLCELCHLAGFRFVIAHANFQLRGEESNRDENFVRALGTKFNTEVRIKRFETATYANTHKCSVQVAARTLRYDWFGQLLDEKSADPADRFNLTPDYLLTAHHLDDNIETLLFHFFRGTGINGLRGMLPRQGRILRPLLFAYKEALLHFASGNKLSWVEDSSNVGDDYSRNYFRHNLIPTVREIFPGAVANLADNLERFRDIEALYRQSIERHKKKLLTKVGNEVHIPVLKLKQLEGRRSIGYEIIREFGFTALQTGELMDLLDSASGKYIQSPTHRIIKNRQWLIIAPRNTKAAQNILIEEGQKNIAGPGFQLHFSVIPAVDCQLSTVNHMAQLDADLISFPLMLRKWKQGDYFYPLGMRKKKKIARLLIDNKLSKTDKEKIWVLESGSRIVWVLGQRIDDRFKITSRTRRLLNIEMRVG